uniref:Uncharacterized protein n=1 Tax=Triticum urartu TaxID=4572 RepID=A0A8R7Q7W5_TRIUA
MVRLAFLPAAEVRRERPDGQCDFIARPLAVAIHGDELDDPANTGNVTELLCLQWPLLSELLVTVVGRALSGQRDEAELWADAMPKQRVQITDQHAFKQIHPAESGASIGEAHVCPEGQLGGKARDLGDPFRGGRMPRAERGFTRVGVSYLGELDKNVRSLLEAHDGGPHPDVGAAVVIGGRWDRREGILTRVVDQIASFRIGAGAVRTGEEREQVLVPAGDVGGFDIYARPRGGPRRPQYAEGGQLRWISEAGLWFQDPQVGEDGVSSVS